MPETPEQVERRRERQRKNSQAYRERHPEQARESRRQCDNKRRRGTGWRPKHPRKTYAYAYVPKPKKPRLNEWALDVKARFLAWRKAA
jgi:hypothetical protein